MTLLVIFAGLQLLVSIFAMLRGGAPERWVAAMLTTALVAGYLTPFDFLTTYRTVNWPMLWIDLALWIGLMIIALYADRFWPLWLAMLQLVAVATHAVRAFDPALWALAYWRVNSGIGWPILFGLFWGVVRHSARKRAGMPEFAWTFQRRRGTDERSSASSDTGSG